MKISEDLIFWTTMLLIATGCLLCFTGILFIRAGAEKELATGPATAVGVIFLIFSALLVVPIVKFIGAHIVHTVDQVMDKKRHQ